ncbi:hypothetical protein CK203_045190 [Vitis vinifera]|uniref:Uncharacterized protein n=1 Tax=Vitis vinifera TaxID=29760 RepID=A0A438H3T6_VITVI|nr:hypothetical protein CK203_045190 [Vitis vinifera]
MCGGDFMSKNLEEAMDFLSYVVEFQRGWDEPTKGEVGKMKSQLSAFNAKAGICVPIVNHMNIWWRNALQFQLKGKCLEIKQMLLDNSRPNNNAPYGNTYNSSWRNHPNFSWKARATQYQQPNPPSQQSSSLEQAIANLNKVVEILLETKKPPMLNQSKN